MTAVQDANCNAGAVAYASACLFDTRTNRPSLGAVNFCPNSFLNSDMSATLPVLVHELVHALVSGARGCALLRSGAAALGSCRPAGAAAAAAALSLPTLLTPCP